MFSVGACGLNPVTFYADKIFDPGPEVARILRKLAFTVETRESTSGGIIQDANGNTIGNWTMNDE